MGNRAQGLLAQLTSVFKGGGADDRVIEARVRSHLGRVVSHPSSMEVRSEQGRVTLSGPVLAGEVGALLSCVARVSGVRGVENRLEVHGRAGDVPGLQGGTRRESRFELMQENWSPAARLLARGATNIELKRLTGMGGGHRAVEIQKTININAPAEQVFEFWRNFENFPRFMANVREVRNLGGGRSRWTVAGPAGVPVSWEAGITRIEPNQIIAWKSAPGSAVANAGLIRFDAVEGGTRVDIKLAYNPPGGALGHAAAGLFGADPKSEMDADLARMKTLVETGNPPRDAAKRQAGGTEAAPASRTVADS
jgi:uncharacterized membrane protein